MPPNASTAFKIFKPPVLDAQRFEQCLDGKFIVRLARDRLAHQRRMRQRVRGIPAACAGIERQPGGVLVPRVAEDVFPGAFIRGPRSFGTDPRGVIEQLLHRDGRLARIAQRLRPGNEWKGRIIKGHLARCQTVLALFRSDGQHG